MATLKSLHIQGVRSYSDKKSQVVTFSTPLTVILGNNGVGKTTIIESLRYVCTESVPPMGDSGRSFVRDPSLSGKTTTKASLALHVRSVETGGIATFQRSFEVTTKQQRPSFRSLSAAYADDATGPTHSITAKGAEDFHVFLGASKSLIDNVLFCHQEDALWPLENDATVKKRFDAIFASQKLNRLSVELTDEAKRVHRRYTDTIHSLALAVQRRDTVLAALSRAHASARALALAKADGASIEHALEVLDRALAGVDTAPIAAADDQVRRAGEARSGAVGRWEAEKRRYGAKAALLAHEALSAASGEAHNEGAVGASAAHVRLALVPATSSVSSALAAHSAAETALVSSSRARFAAETAARDADDRERATVRAAAAAEAAVERVGEVLAAVKEWGQQWLRLHRDASTGSSAIEVPDDVAEAVRVLQPWSDPTLSLAHTEVNAAGDAIKALLDATSSALTVSSTGVKSELDPSDPGDAAASALARLHVLSRALARVAATCCASAASAAAAAKATAESARGDATAARVRVLTATSAWEGRKAAAEKAAAAAAVAEKEAEAAWVTASEAVAAAEARKTAAVAALATAAAAAACASAGSSEASAAATEAAEKATREWFADASARASTDTRLTFESHARAMAQLRPDIPAFAAAVAAAEAVSGGDSRFEDASVEQLSAAAAAAAAAVLVAETVTAEALTAPMTTESEAEALVRATAGLAAGAATATALAAAAAALQRVVRSPEVNADSTAAQETLNAAEAEAAAAEAEQRDAAGKSQAASLRRARAETLREAADAAAAEAAALGHDTSAATAAETAPLARAVEAEAARDAVATAAERVKAFVTSAADNAASHAASFSSMRDSLTHAGSQARSQAPAAAAATAATKAAVAARATASAAAAAEVAAVAEERTASAALATAAGAKEILEAAEAAAAAGEVWMRAVEARDAAAAEAEAAVRGAGNEGLLEELRALDLVHPPRMGDIDGGRSDRLDFAHLARERSRLQGLALQTQGRISTLATEASSAALASSRSDNAEAEVRSLLAKATALSLAEEDLYEYSRAYDAALLQLHEERLAGVNMALRRLWAEAYQGKDIEDVFIMASDDNSTGSSSTAAAAPTATRGMRRQFQYRVMMRQRGQNLVMRGRCSAGQKVLVCFLVRLALAEALCGRSTVIALDEPTTNLDSVNAEGLAQVLNGLLKRRGEQSGFQLVVITHDEPFVQNVAEGLALRKFQYVSKNKSGESVVTSESF